MTGEVYIPYGADAFDPSHGFPVVNTKYSWVKAPRRSMGIEKTCVLRLGQMVRGEFLSGLRRRTLISVYHAKSGKSSGHS